MLSSRHIMQVTSVAQDAMQLIRTALAIAIGAFATCGAITSASAQQQQAKPPTRTIIIDRSINRPPPPPHERTYVGPGPTVVPPMERLPQVPPLAQPPTR